MTRDNAIDRLPESYAIALRLHGAGVTDEQLAAGFAIDAASVPSFLAIAEAKLAALTPRAPRQRKDER